mgnify:CR=1 FL=1
MYNLPDLEPTRKLEAIAVLTSGGDSPGMNPAIRAVVRTALNAGIRVYGVQKGYSGLIIGDMAEMISSDVSNIVQRGGTMLKSDRCAAFKDPTVRKQAATILQEKGIDGLVVIGGDGSYMGAKKLTEMGYPCIGLPGTIDNDIAGTDYTIGYLTALNTVIDAIDRLRDTSSSHQRISIVEIMGRHCGDLTLTSAIAGGCEYIITPETGLDKEQLISNIQDGIAKGKKHAIIALTELMMDANELAKEIETATGRETRATVLGHIQRGGRPTAFDRVLASRMGNYAVHLLMEGHGGRCVGIQKEQLVHHDIIDAIENMKRPVRDDLYKVAEELF